MAHLIKSIKVNKNSLIITPNCEFKSNYLNDIFKATYDDNIDLENLDFSILSIPFIMSVISLVWESGKTYFIQAMDAELFNALKIIKDVYKVFYPNVAWNGELIPDQLITNHLEKRREPLIGLAFSGGLDSTYSSLAHYPSKQLLITLFGFSQEIKDNQWSLVKQRCREFSKQSGHINCFIESNFREFIDYSKLHERHPKMITWREYCQEAISIAGLSAPILILKQCPTFLISSSFHWRSPVPWGSHPFIDNNIRFSGVGVKNYTPDLNRQTKIQKLIDLCNVNDFPKPTLYVCNKLKTKALPCCKCMKCLMTINGILAEGENPKTFGFIRSSRYIKFKTKKMFRKNKIQDFYEEPSWQII